MIQVNKKTIYIIVAILVVIIVAVAAAALLMNNSETSDTPTPTPEPVSITDGDSLKFTATDNTNEITYACAVKDLNANDEIVRIDADMSGTVYSYILNLDDSTSYMSTDAGATWKKSNFTEDSVYIVMVHDFVTELQDNWDGTSATYSYTADGIEYVISNINVNPTFEDSFFATS